MISSYNRFIVSVFLKNIFIVSIFFLSLVLILNILEEITFFKNSEVSFILPIFLTFLNSLSVLFEIFPFIILIGTMSFFLEILDKNELIIFKSYGLSNLKIISVTLSTTFILGIFLVLIFYNISSSLKFLYLDIKNNHTDDGKYLSVITANGLWIKDHVNGNINIINARKIDGEKLVDVLISQFDKNYNFVKLINAKEVNIKDMNWQINDAVTTENSLSTKNKEIIIFETNFDSKKISNLFSSLASLNLIKLNKLRKDYKALGYSTTEINNHILSLFTYPIYLSIMMCIASILMLNISHNKPRVFYLITGIAISVGIYYMKFLFNILIVNGKFPNIFSIWFPLFLLFLFCLVGLVRINEK
jgi:lipopolysaccharide export system permease protein|tara:strand:- start:362 stop:1441 length:1080 start_codon:yes stop_codon:yes gene_type:complete